jgi:hypothetical protein
VASPVVTSWDCNILMPDSLMATGSIFVSVLALPEEQSVAGGTYAVSTQIIHTNSSALFQTLVQLGGSFGLAVTAVIASSYQMKALDNGASAVGALLNGLHAAFWLAAGCSFAALLAAVVMLRGMGCIGKNMSKGQGEESKKPEGDSSGGRESDEEAGTGGAELRSGGGYDKVGEIQEKEESSPRERGDVKV